MFNVAIAYDGFSLAPAYDHVSITVSGTNETGLAFGSAREFDALDSTQMGRMVLRSAYDMVERVREIWKSERDSVPELVARVIDDQFVRVPLFSESSKFAIRKLFDCPKNRNRGTPASTARQEPVLRGDHDDLLRPREDTVRARVVDTDVQRSRVRRCEAEVTRFAGR